MGADAVDRRTMMASGAALALAPAGAHAEGRSSAAGAADDVAKITTGRVKGLRGDRGVLSFKGIPYGAPTGGAARFLPPRKPQPWTGVREAFAFGPQCPQVNQFPPATQAVQGILFPHQDGGTFGEDCLVLNVWTPDLRRDAKRPVMVWIHGGRWIGGSGGEPSYEGSNLARQGDVVVVTLNHRLGVLGYLHLGEAAGEAYANSGNAGVEDLVLALNWVRENIEAFGGDPERVMIFGQSGGGQKVSMLLATPAAKGLFHRAVIHSGPGRRMLTLAQADRSRELVLDGLGLGPADWTRLREVPADKLVALQTGIIRRFNMDNYAGLVGGFAGICDGRFLPEHPFDTHPPAISADVPIMIGVTGTEMSLYSIGYPETRKLAFDQLAERFRLLHGHAAEAVVAAYRKAYPFYAPGDLFERIRSDYPLGKQSIEIAELKAAQGRAPAFMYQLEWRSPTSAGPVNIRSPHGLDVPLVFNNAARAAGMTGDTADAAIVAAQMSQAWINFARNGDPNTEGLPAWAPYSKARRAAMLFNVDSRIVDDPLSVGRKVFEAHDADLVRAIPIA